ncbi:retrovirus-related pol polyprotein from transposon TNT 1-94 [Tanacetum coccineum]
MFKTFKVEVKNQLDRKIKVVRSDRGGEYYGRHTDVGQAPRSFFDFCEDHGIINQYTMPSTPQHNGVAERRNRTLMNMVHSMLANSNLPEFLWTEALKMAVHILNIPKLSYTPQSRKLDLKTISCFFIGYPERSKGYRFYYPSHSTIIVETRHTKFLENANNGGRGLFRRIELQEARDEIPIIHGAKPVGCKWVYKTKLDPNGNVERYKAHLVAKGYTQKEGVDYKETFSPISRKDSLRIVMVLVAHFDLELHQVDVKTAFLNGDLHEDVYMAQPQGFKSKGQEHLVCKLKKSIYGLKEASRQWYLKFDEVMKKHNFIKNQVDKYVYLKMSGSNFIIFVLYVDDILLASNNIDLLHESKRFLSRNFDMKDLGEASFQSNPGLLHWKAAKKVLRYLQGTKEYKLTYTRSKNLKVIGYSDSDFAKCKDTSRSTSRYIFKLSGGPISWKSHKQVLTTTSTTMAEYAIKDYYDNNAAVSFSNSNSSNGAGLYLDTKYLFVRERVEEQRISIEHIRTHEMLVDPLTKVIEARYFNNCRFTEFGEQYYELVEKGGYYNLVGTDIGYRQLRRRAGTIIYHPSDPNRIYISLRGDYFYMAILPKIWGNICEVARGEFPFEGEEDQLPEQRHKRSEFGCNQLLRSKRYANAALGIHTVGNASQTLDQDYTNESQKEPARVAIFQPV